MLKVRIRIDLMEQPKALKLNGFAAEYPEKGKEFSMFIMKGKTKVYVDLGKVFNINTYGDMLLIQTDSVVAEVWILGGEREGGAEILPFIKDRNTLFLKGGVITSLNKGKKSTTSAQINSLIKNLKLLKEMTVGISRGKTEPKLSLVGGRNVKVNPNCDGTD